MTDLRQRISDVLCNRLADLGVAGGRYVADNLVEAVMSELGRRETSIATDVIERAEAALKSDCLDSALAVFVPPLIAELKAARAENEQLRRDCRPGDVYHHTAEEWGQREGCHE